MNAETMLQRMDDCLVREIDTSLRLLQDLREENEALSTRDAGRIEEVTGNKIRTLEALGQLDQERDQLLEQAGFRDGEESPEDCFLRCDPRQQTALLRNWRRLLELAETCQRQNAINGALIQSGLRHTRQALCLLQGQTAEEIPHYGPGGTHSSPPPAHSFGKA